LKELSGGKEKKTPSEKQCSMQENGSLIRYRNEAAAVKNALEQLRHEFRFFRVHFSCQGWWGRWDLNPGSLAPQASILIHQPKKSPKIQGFLGMLDDGPSFGDFLDGRKTPLLQEYYRQILNTIEQLTADGKAQNTLRLAAYTLKRLNKETDLMNPEAVKLHVGRLEVSNQKKRSYKRSMAIILNGSKR